MEEKRPHIVQRITLLEIIKHLESMVNKGSETVERLKAIHNKDFWNESDWKIIRECKKELKERINNEQTINPSTSN